MHRFLQFAAAKPTGSETWERRCRIYGTAPDFAGAQSGLGLASKSSRHHRTCRPRQRGSPMKILAAIMGIAVVLSSSLHANAQSTAPKVADAKPGDVRVIATAAITRTSPGLASKQSER